MLFLLGTQAALGWSSTATVLETHGATHAFAVGESAQTAAQVLCTEITACEVVPLGKKWRKATDEALLQAHPQDAAFILRSVPGAPDTVRLVIFDGAERVERYVWYDGMRPQSDDALEVTQRMVMRLEEEVRESEQRATRLERERERDRERDRIRERRRASRGRAPSEEKVQAWLDEAGIQRDSQLSAVIHTSMGDIACQLFPDGAPLTVANFVALAEGKKSWIEDGKPVTKPLYDGTTFHRVIRDFMIQGGDPEGTGRGGSGTKFENEDSGRKFDQKGRLAMANAGPGTNSAQFFITVRPSLPYLDRKHTVFGQCDPEIPIAISQVATTRDKPNEDVVIERITIER